MISSFHRQADIIARCVQRKCYRRIIQRLNFSSSQNFPKQLVDNIRCLSKENDHLLPCFELSSQHVPRVMKDPCEFHQWLCRSVAGANQRILLASLYIGDDLNNREEQELINALTQNTKVKQKKILVDANRAKRSIPIIPSMEQYFFSTTTDNIPRFVPNIIKEVLGGVFHIKMYIIDDQLVLSGANLSQEYFTSRQDRYILFPNGGSGLVDFYARFMDILCNYAHKLPSELSSTARSYIKNNNNFSDGSQFYRSSKEDEERRLILIEDLTNLFLVKSSNASLDKNTNKKNDIIAYAIPTYQSPSHLLPGQVGIDNEVIRNFITQTMSLDRKELALKSLALRLSSAYLNPTDNFLSLINQFSTTSFSQQDKCDRKDESNNNHLYLMTASLKSHGFAPKHGNSQRNIKDIVPFIFMELAYGIASKYDQTILLYHRKDWTFHAKGLWLTARNFEFDAKKSNNDKKTIDDNHSLDVNDKNSLVLATMIGSSNYGARSELLDIESNCLLVLNHDRESSEWNNALKKLNNELINEWNNLNQYAKSMGTESLERISMNKGSSPFITSILSMPIVMRTLLKYIRRYF